jgi:hypothetical protein
LFSVERDTSFCRSQNSGKRDKLYLPPAVDGAAMFLTGAVLKHWWLAGRNWSEVALAAALMGTV